MDNQSHNKLISDALYEFDPNNGFNQNQDTNDTVAYKWNKFFLPVILAGGVGTRLFPLTTSHQRKYSLPIANRPLLWYQLHMVSTAGFNHVIIITEEDCILNVRSCVQDYNTQFKTKLTAEVLPTAAACGTADALRMNAAKLNTGRELIIISGDVVSDLPLLSMIAEHKLTKSTLTMCLFPQSASPLSKITTTVAPAGNKKQQPKKGGKKGTEPVVELSEELKKEKKKEKEEFSLDRQYIAMEVGSGRVAYMRSVNSVEDIELPKYMFQRLPNLTFLRDMINAHIYICSPTILNLLHVQPTLSSFQNEVVPLITSNQFATLEQNWSYSTPRVLNNDVVMSPSVHRLSTTQNKLSSPAYSNVSNTSVSSTQSTAHSQPVPINMEDTHEAKHLGIYRLLDEEEKHNTLSFSHTPSLSNALTCNIRVQAYLPPLTCFVERVNTVLRYKKCNLALLPRSQIVEEHTLFKELPEIDKTAEDLSKEIGGSYTNTSFGKFEQVADLEKCTIEDCVIGNNCKIAKGARLKNVVIMDNVTIGPTTKISDTVICNNVIIKQNTTLRGCIVCPGITIVSDSEHTDEIISENPEVYDDSDNEDDEEQGSGLEF